MIVRHVLSVCVITVCVLSSNLAANGPTDTHIDAVIPRATRQINHFVRQRWNEEGIVPAERCSDREYVRRIYLDLAGRVPSLAEVEFFLADERTEKRAALVDALLASEDCAQHFADLFDVLLMGRANEGKYQERVKHGWRAYLEEVFRDNRPWNQVAAELVRARPNDEARRGSVWFLYERNNQHQAIAEAVAPAFFGIRIECAQCHDHMVAEEIKQAHYWGLVAFFNRSKNVDTKLGPRVAESAIGGFSAFANLSGQSSPNELSFFGADTIAETRPDQDEKQADADELYAAAAIEGAPRIPRFSRRDRFADEVLDDHPLLARAMVNRLWTIMLGRGIIHPYDEMDSVHEASHPELLGWLAADFASSGYDMRRLLRSLALSDAYQLNSMRPEGADDPASFAWYLERPLTAEQLARSIQLVARGTFSNDEELVSKFRQQIPNVLPDETVFGVSESLFYSNAEILDRFLVASKGDGHLISQLLQMHTNDERVRQLFLTTLGREPEMEESAAVVAYLDKRQDALESAISRALWSLVTSAEFQLNH
jgi:hypothetical protein